MRNRNRINRAYQHVEPDTDNQPVADEQPFGKVLYGSGNDGESGYEGIVYKHVIGTYLHGPLLPKNPQVCDWLIEKALERKYGEEIKLQPLDDQEEKEANAYIVNRFVK